MSATPRTSTPRPHTSRLRETSEWSIDTSDMAATGGTRVDRNAGTTADSTVTPTPMRRARATTPTVSGGSPLWTEKNDPTAALSPAARNTPSTRPITDATRPTARASIMIEPRTWCRLAPIARSSAVSRLRWATMIENVL